MSERESLVRLDKLEALLALASPQALETAEIVRRDDEYLDCPCCDGEGSVDGATYLNYDGFAVGVQFFGVGEQFVHNEEAFRALWRDAPWLMECARDLYVSLKHAVEIIEKHVPRDALGTNAQGDPSVPNGYEEWPLLDEYLHHMRVALSKAEGQPNCSPQAVADVEGKEP